VAAWYARKQSTTQTTQNNPINPHSSRIQFNPNELNRDHIERVRQIQRQRNPLKPF